MTGGGHIGYRLNPTLKASQRVAAASPHGGLKTLESDVHVMTIAIGELSSEENVLSIFFHVLASPIVYFYSTPMPKILNGADSVEGISVPLGYMSSYEMY